MNLALFDLDHTLLPIDSDYGWGQFLISLGVVDADVYRTRNAEFYAQYQAGTLDIHAFLNFLVQPLIRHDRAQLDAWHARFMREVIEPQIRPAALALIGKHKNAGDDCVVVTATNSFITRPIVARLGLGELIATELETIDGQFTGKVLGTPSFREGKITRTEEWLHERQKTWQSFDTIHFYSDSANDLPLLEKVTHPVATNPDARLLQIAQTRGWPVLRLFE
ncbi:MAG: HAD family hydrolase [Burkholderiaceae bacterium]|jgi:HAD superfamily hydrolase (TIGR01490 family)